MTVGIVGLGLIGGSIGKALKKYTDVRALGYDIDGDAVAQAQKAGAIDGELTADDLKNVDVLIVALKEAATVKALAEYCPRLKDGATVMDCCGNKRTIAAQMAKLKEELPQLHFVGIHPMAGKERSGIRYASADLFKNAYVVAVPIADDEAAVGTAKSLYLSMGAKAVNVASAQTHDKMIAYTSQLAHIVSACYILCPEAANHVGFSAGSFLDMTRVARLDADMWTELFLNNSDNLAQCVDNVIRLLQQFKTAIEGGDGEALRVLLQSSTKAKEEADAADKGL